MRSALFSIFLGSTLIAASEEIPRVPSHQVIAKAFNVPEDAVTGGIVEQTAEWIRKKSFWTACFVVRDNLRYGVTVIAYRHGTVNVDALRGEFQRSLEKWRFGKYGDIVANGGFRVHSQLMRVDESRTGFNSFLESPSGDWDLMVSVCWKSNPPGHEHRIGIDVDDPSLALSLANALAKPKAEQDEEADAGNAAQ